MIDGNGELIWSQRYQREEGIDGGSEVIELSQGGFLLATGGFVDDERQDEAIVMKTDSVGHEQWRAVYGTEFNDYCNTVAEDYEGFYWGGGTYIDDDRNYHDLLAKIDQDGNVVRVIRGEAQSINNMIVSKLDGNIVTCGISLHGVVIDGRRQPAYLWLAKWNRDGELMWQLDIEGRGEANRVLELPDHSYVVAGTAHRPYRRDEPINPNFLLAKTTPDPLAFEPEELEPLDSLHDFQSLAVDSSVVFGLGLVNTGRRYLFIDSTALEGDTAVFSCDLGRLGNLPYRISPSDTSFLPVTFHPVADTTYSALLTFFFGDSQSVEMEFLGRGGGSGIEDCRLKIEDWGIEEVWPNPFNSEVQISFTLPEAHTVKLAIYDLSGKIVVEHTGKMEAGLHQEIWKADAFPAGLYFLKVTAGNDVKTVKLLLLK
jgi:hypothetical protein